MYQRYYRILISWLVILMMVLASIPLLEAEVFAKSRRSGGRVGGKSGFSRKSPSIPSYSRSRDYQSSDYTRDRNTTTHLPVPIGGGSPGFFYSSPRYYVGGGESAGSLLFWALVVGALVFVGVVIFSRMNSRAALGGSGTTLRSLANASIIKFQLALLSAARELQEELNKIAETADTDDPAGLQLLLQETTLALIRHPDYWMQADVNVISTPSYEVAESKFDSLVMTERMKFSEETFSNVEGRVRKKESKPGQDKEVDEISDYIVITLIVATKRTFQPLPAIKTEELRKILTSLGSLSPQELLAVEVLWTPQKTTDVLTEDDLLVGYPELRQIL